MQVFNESLCSGNKSKGLICLPHSGQYIPEEFQEFLSDDLKALNEDVDYKVFDLIDIKELNQHGIDIIIAQNIRTSVDLNRARNEALLNWKENTKGVEIVKKTPSIEKAEILLNTYYDAYFNRVKELIERIETTPKRAIDLHSMPSRATSYHLKKNPNQKKQRPAFCLSDLEGLSSPKDYMDYALNCFREKGFIPGYNDPYKGGQGTVFLNQQGTQSMQIEINRELYMDEETKLLNLEKANNLKPNLTQILTQILFYPS